MSNAHLKISWDAGRRECRQAVGHTGRFYVSYVHWYCDGGRHLDCLEVITLRGAIIEGGLGCFVIGRSSPAYHSTNRRLGCLANLQRRGALQQLFALQEAK